MNWGKALNLESFGVNRGKPRRHVTSLFWWFMDRPLAHYTYTGNSAPDLRGREIVCLADYQAGALGVRSVARRHGVSSRALQTLLASVGLPAKPKPHRARKLDAAVAFGRASMAEAV